MGGGGTRARRVPAAHEAHVDPQGGPPHTLPPVNTNCTAPSLVPTVNGNTVRSCSTHGQQSAAKGNSTTVSRSAIRLI
jgi:hypothetical protein